MTKVHEISHIIKRSMPAPSFYVLPLILLLALGLRLLLWSAPPHQPANDEVEYIAVARDLLAGRGWQFYERYHWLRAPLYPLFLAGSLWLAGGDPAGGEALYRAALPNIALSVLNVWLIARLARALLGRRAEGVAALISTLLWTFATFAGLYMAETLFTTLFTAGLLCLAPADTRPETGDRRPQTGDGRPETRDGSEIGVIDSASLHSPALSSQLQARLQVLAAAEPGARFPDLALSAQVPQLRLREQVNAHWPLGGATLPQKAAALANKLVRRYLRWYINPIVEQQNAANAATTAALLAIIQLDADRRAEVAGLRSQELGARSRSFLTPNS